ncbi:tumor necrosis factor receptor superfamily member 12A [Arapaima gigas]
MILGAGTNAQNSKCARDEFWNTDIAQCVPCTTCQKYPKTPSCDTCLPMEKGPDVWKLAAITSFSTLAIVLLAGPRGKAPYVSLLRRPLDLFIKHEHFSRGQLAKHDLYLWST